MAIEHWSFFLSQHLLGIPQLLSGLLYVESRASGPLNNRFPETDRFACVASAHRIVSSDLDEFGSKVDHLQPFNILHPSQALDC